MALFRLVVYLLLQLLLFLFVAGSKDMLGGWIQADSAMGTLLALFFLWPISAVTLCGFEIKYFCTGARKPQIKRALLTVLALLVLSEALAIDIYLLTQVRM